MTEKSGIASAVMHLVEAEINLVRGIVGALAGSSAGKHHSHHGNGCKCSHPCASKGGCSCRIPTPCWLPDDLGDCIATVEPCGSAHLTIVVRNTDGQQRQIAVSASGPGSQYVTVTPASATVPPFGSATFNVAVAVPQGAAGTYVDAQIWITKGCRAHVLNWRVDVDKCCGHEKGSHEIVVCDGADFVHHWYDHFYCPRRCPPQHDIPSGIAAS